MCVRVIASVAILICSLRAYAVEESKPVPLSDVKLDTAKLKSWGERNYAMNYIEDEKDATSARRVGSMTLGCEFKDGKIKLVSDAKMFIPPDGKRFVKFRQDCVYPEKNLLALSEITTNVVRSDGKTLKQSHSTVRGEELITVDKDGERSSTSKTKWPANGVLDVTVFYLVSIMPREAGRRYSTEQFIVSTELEKTDSRIIECVGPDRDTGKPGKHWVKFLSYRPENRDRAIQFWVDSDGVLRRAQMNKTNRMDLEETKKAEPKESP